jgi:two-component system nitrogen regulation response regulator GlnG
VPTLLVIDDEPGVCYSFKRVFAAEGVEVRTAGSAAAGLRALHDGPADVVILDLQLPDRSGLDLFGDILALDAKRPVIFITAHGTTETAIEAMKRGAFDYLVKPLDLDRLTQVVGRALDAARLMRQPAALPAEAGDRIVGRGAAVQEMSKAVGRLAPLDVPVLILGESGTGKELVARALYQHSRRAARPFLAINCAALPETLLESELFGHEKGAFTGADRRRVGKFEQCDGGTIFLDEIGDMAPAVQAKMLRVLQEQAFERLGGNETVRTDVRLIAATNKDLEKEVAAGLFRADLYYRLKVVTLRVPPLRERREDVAELAHHFLFQYNRELRRDLRGIDPEALEALARYDWPGNVRELQGVIKQAMLHVSGHLLPAEALPENVRRARPAAPAQASSGVIDVGAVVDDLLRQGATDIHARVVALAEREMFARVLRHTHGHQTRASELLGINRATLRARLRDLGLALDKVPVDEARPD